MSVHVNESRDWRLEAWRPLTIGAIARIREKCAGRYAGAVVRVVEVFDQTNNGMARLNVECVPELCGDAPLHGYDPAMQHDGSRLDVCRWELSNAVNAANRAYARRLQLEPPEARATDRKAMPALVDSMRRGIQLRLNE